MPCLNEIETLERCITKAKNFLQKSGIDGEVLIADNGSTDGSQELAKSLGARVVDVPIRGYGAALGAGIKAAKGRFVIMGDSDDSYNFSKLMPFMQPLRDGYDLVMGNRFKGGIAPGAMPFLHRYLGNPVLTFIGKLFFGSPSNDFHCGLRGVKRKSILALDLRTTGMEFASEMVVKASLRKLKIMEVPTTLDKDGRSRPPHLRTWRDGWRHLRFLLMYCPRWLFFYPGMILFIVGMGGMIWLIPGPQQVDAITFDVHTLLVAGTAAIIGAEILLFAFVAKHASIVHGLLPPDPKIDATRRLFNLERLLVIGLLVAAIGVYGIAHSALAWRASDYGALDISSMMRALVPSCVAVVIGLQTAFGAFLADILGLGVQK
jgi:hypothetical protein